MRCAFIRGSTVCLFVTIASYAPDDPLPHSELFSQLTTFYRSKRRDRFARYQCSSNSNLAVKMFKEVFSFALEI